MGKSAILEILTNEWEQLLSVAQNIPDHALEIPGSVGHWSVAQVLIHVASWDEEVRDRVDESIKSGIKRVTPNSTVHELNERLLEENKEKDLLSTWMYFYGAHSALVAYLETLPEEIFDPGSYTGNWIVNIVPQHYSGHREDIKMVSEQI